MTQWRIRVAVPEHLPEGARCAGPGTGPGTVVHLDPLGVDVAETSGDVIVELGEDEALGDLLRTLYEVSPHVYVSRVSSPETEAGQPIRVRKLSRMRDVSG